VAADKEFLAEVEKSEKTKEAFQRCRPVETSSFCIDKSKSWLLYIAGLEHADAAFFYIFALMGTTSEECQPKEKTLT